MNGLIVVVPTALLGNYLPLLGESGWLLTMVMGAFCAFGWLDAAAQPVEYARSLGKVNIDKKTQEGYRKRKRWLALAIFLFIVLTAMCLPYLDVPVLLLVSFLLGRVAALAYCRQKLSARELVLWVVFGTVLGAVPSLIGWSIQSLPFLAALRPSLAMGIIRDPLSLASELLAYLLPCALAIALIALRRPKTLAQLEIKFGSS